MSQETQLPQPPNRYLRSHRVLGPFLRLAGLSCRHAFALSVQKLDRHLRPSEAARLRMHLAFCSLCRNLPAQFESLRSLVREAEAEAIPTDSTPALPLDSRERIARHLESIAARGPDSDSGPPNQ